MWRQCPCKLWCVLFAAAVLRWCRMLAIRFCIYTGPGCLVRCKVRALIIVWIERQKVRALTDWWFELNWLCRRLVVPPGQNLLRILWMYAHEIVFRRPGTSRTPLTLSLQEVSTTLDWPSIWLKISYFIVRRHIGMRVISCQLWGIWLFYSQNASMEADLHGFRSASWEVRSKSCHRTHV